MQHAPLNELYYEYQIGDLDKIEFEGAIYNYLINNQDKTFLFHWKDEEYEDFISWFCPRLQKTIEAYQETGASFDAFVNKFLLLASKEYRIKTVSNAVTEYSTWSARVPDMYVYSEPPVYTYNDNNDLITQLVIDKKGRRNTKQLLALVLKCYYHISPDFAEKIAPLLGITAHDLTEMLNQLRKIRQKRDDYIYSLKERIYCQFYRCIVYDKKLSLTSENTSEYFRLKQQLERGKQRLEKMRMRMAGIRTDATNKQVADIIGVRKGTIDSCLYKLKLKWDNLAKNAELN